MMLVQLATQMIVQIFFLEKTYRVEQKQVYSCLYGKYTIINNTSVNSVFCTLNCKPLFASLTLYAMYVSTLGLPLVSLHIMLSHYGLNGQNFIKLITFIAPTKIFFSEPWLVWLRGLSASLQTKESWVCFPVRAHTWVAGQVSSRGHMRGNHTLMFLSLSFCPLLLYL